MPLSYDALSYVLTRTNQDCKKYKGQSLLTGRCQYIVDHQRKEQCEREKNISYCKLCAREFCDYHIRDYNIVLRNDLPQVTRFIKNSNGIVQHRTLVFSDKYRMLLDKNIEKKNKNALYTIQLCSNCNDELRQQNELNFLIHDNNVRTLRPALGINDATRKWYETKNKKKNPTGGKNTRKLRKHQGIYQSGPKMGQLKPGFKYSGKKTKTGLPIIIKVKNSK